MKIKNKILAIILGTVVMVSCEGPEPAIPFDTFNFAAYVRTLQVVSGSFDVFNLGTSRFEVNLEEVDETNGKLIDKLEVFVKFNDNTPGNGTITRPEALVATLPASSWTVDATSGYPRVTLNVTAQQAVTAIGGLDLTDVQGKDSFDFRLLLTLTDGRTYSNNQSSGDVAGGAFYASPFFYRVNVVCPLAPTFMVGDYLYEPVVNGPFGPIYGNAKVVQLQTVGTSVVLRRIVGLIYLEQLGIGNASQNIDLSLVCGDVVMPSMNTNLGCGSGSISVGNGAPANRTTYDLTDDSVIEVGVTEFVIDGGCGEPPAQVRFRLTKQ